MIAAALNARYRELAAKGQEEREWKFGPSNLGSCLRLAAFMLQGEKQEPLAPEPFRVFELGHQRGEKLEAIAKDIWPDAQSQVPISIPLGKFTIKGTCDLWIPSLRTVVDFKTVGAFGAGLLESEGPSEEYQLQVHAYRHGLWDRAEDVAAFGASRRYTHTTASANALLALSGIKAIKALIVYEVKDSDARKGVRAGQLIECEVPYTDELEERYQKRLMEIEGLLIRKEQGTLDPYKVPGLPKSAWKCRSGKDGQPLYCAIGSKRGRCHE